MRNTKSTYPKTIKYSDDPRYYVVKGHPHGMPPGQAKKYYSNDKGKDKWKDRGDGNGRGNGKGNNGNGRGKD